MTKEELIERVGILEAKLSISIHKIDNILKTATDILRFKKSNSYWVGTTDNIENTNELFFEIWKLVSFRDETNNRINYERQQISYKNELDFLKNKLNKNK